MAPTPWIYELGNNDLVKKVGELQAQKLQLEHKKESISLWYLGFLVLSIIIALMKDLFA
jgi:hypothetical protein